MGKFGATLVRYRKTDNARSGRQAKIRLRELVLAEIGAEQARVFDAFAGSGEMHRAVWHRAGGYAGCDLRHFPDERLAFVADNVRVMRAIDLEAFNVFDLDAYGSPWHQALILATRRKVAKGERIGIILTEGSGLKLKLGGMPRALGQLAGLRGRVAGTARAQDDVTDRALAELAKKMACTVVKRWQAKGKKGSAMRYIAVVLEGK